MENRFKRYYAALLLTTFLPFIPYVLPFFPQQFFGFNLTGWAWIIMLTVTLAALLATPRLSFPVLLWIPWIGFLVIYLIMDYSFLGIQLTMQYLLPLLVGMVTSGFVYSDQKLEWLAKWFKKLCIAVLLMFAFGQFFRGYSPAAAAVPMLLSIAGSFIAGLYYITKEKRYLAYFGILFLIPFLDVTRMGIAVFLMIFIFHFANRKIAGKFAYGLVGVIMVILVFNSSAFQTKTFYGGKGKISDLSFDYHENSDVNSSGRSSLKKALEPGVKSNPLLGNGPRADYIKLISFTGNGISEAHDDYLSIRYNYGWVGLFLLMFGFVSTFISLYFGMRKERNALVWLLYTATLMLLITFVMFMYSDNILKYTIYFPNYFFALIGIIYSIRKSGLQTV